MAYPIPWSEVKALSFDIYGTLLDTQTGVSATARATALGQFLPKDNEELASILLALEGDVQRERPTMLQSDVLAEGMRRWARDQRLVEGGQLTQCEVDAAANEYGSQMGQYTAFPDTVDAMQRLGKHYKLIALSNVDHKSFNATLAGPLKAVKFDAIYLAEDIGSYKPDLKNFEYLFGHMAKDLSIEAGPQHCHVAHSLEYDHAPAKRMGIASIWIARRMIDDPRGDEKGQRQFGYQAKVESLGDLADIVDEAFFGS